MESSQAYVVPVFTKNKKQELKNYRLIALLTISGKLFEKLLHDSIFFLSENSLRMQ